MESRHNVRIALLLALSFFLFYLLFSHGHFAGTDEVGVFEQTKSLYERGDLAVPPGKHVFPGKDGRLYSHFPVGQSVLALPFFALGKLAESILPEPWVRALAGVDSRKGTIVWGGTAEIFAVGLYAPVVSALLVGLFFLFERRLGASLRSALLASVLLGTTTYVAMMSVFFLQHTSEALTILGGLYGFHAFKESRRWRALVAGSLFASLTILIRIPACVAGPALGGYLAWILYRRAREEGTAPVLARALPCIGLPLAAVLTIHVVVNFGKWGTWIWSPFLDQVVAFTTPLYVGAYGFLLSPGCSIFLHSPLLLLLRSTFPPFWRDSRAEATTLVGISLIFFVVCSKFEVWSGLFSSPGPRYLFVLTPLLMLPLGPWLDGARSRAEKIAVGGLGLLGAAVQLVLMMAHWGNVIEIMQWQKFVPELSFVWIPDWSPLAGCLNALAQGIVDPWLWGLGMGRPGREGTPIAAAVLLVVWGLCFAAAVVSLLRSVRNAER